MHNQIEDKLENVSFVLSNVHEAFSGVQNSHVLVGSAKNYMTRLSTLVPHDLDIVVPVVIHDEYPLNILPAISSWQEKLVSIFKQAGLSSGKFPVQIHTSPTSRVNSGWIQMRMTPPANHRGYLLGSFLASLGAESNVYFGYTGATRKINGETKLITLEPNFSRDVLAYLNKDENAIDWKTDTIENMWISSRSLIEKCEGNVDRFHNAVLKRISIYEKTDDNYEYTLSAVRNLK